MFHIRMMQMIFQQISCQINFSLYFAQCFSTMLAAFFDRIHTLTHIYSTNKLVCMSDLFVDAYFISETTLFVCLALYRPCELASLLEYSMQVYVFSDSLACMPLSSLAWGKFHNLFVYRFKWINTCSNRNFIMFIIIHALIELLLCFQNLNFLYA